MAHFDPAHLKQEIMRYLEQHHGLKQSTVALYVIRDYQQLLSELKVTDSVAAPSVTSDAMQEIVAVVDELVEEEAVFVLDYSYGLDANTSIALTQRNDETRRYHDRFLLPWSHLPEATDEDSGANDKDSAAVELEPLSLDKFTLREWKIIDHFRKWYWSGHEAALRGVTIDQFPLIRKEEDWFDALATYSADPELPTEWKPATND